MSDKDVVGSCVHFPGIVYNNVWTASDDNIVYTALKVHCHGFRKTNIYYTDCIENPCKVIQTQLQ